MRSIIRSEEGKIRWGVVFLFIIGFLIIVPIILWFSDPSTPITAVMLDKTVPNFEYREHRAPTWVLNHYKYVKRGTGDRFKFDKDYVGFFPEKDKKYHITTFPPKEQHYDLIYLADTYGVYQGNFLKEGDEGSRHTLIYGGLESEEVAWVMKHLRNGTVLVAEFNVFGSPTEEGPRKLMTDILGINWGGWIGRYIPDLTEGGEVADWVVRAWEGKHQKEWTFTGPGFVFVHLDETLLVMPDPESEGVRVVFPEEQREYYGTINNAHYNYWFDVVSPNEGTEVIGNYVMDISEKNKEILREVGIPATLPAIFKRKNFNYTSYYFAGDFADTNIVPVFYKYKWMADIFKYMIFSERSPAESFLWSVYIPLMNTILSEVPR
ncbi:hypothetical protein ACFLRA_00330 [Bdellovibrionota bacterium]